MEITISIDPETISIDDDLKHEIVRAVELIGENYDAADCEVSITLTDDARIHELNRQYRQIDRATDVLSFAFNESEEPKIEYGGEEHVDQLGDIVVNVERAREQANEYGHSFKREMIFLIVHGMLHLLGYDHIDEDERREMEAEQKFIMSELGIAR